MTSSELKTIKEDMMQKIADGCKPVERLILYRYLKNAYQCTMDGIEFRIDKLIKEELDLAKAQFRAIVLILCGLMAAISGCTGTMFSAKPPSAWDPMPAGLVFSDEVTDRTVNWFASRVYQTFSTRAFRAEAGDLGAAVAESSLATGATIAAGTGATPAAIAMVAAIGDWLANLNTMVNPQMRATILSEGAGLILDAQTAYFQERIAAGIQKTSRKVLTSFGAKFLGSVNSSIRVTSGALAGMFPRFSDYARLQPPKVAMPEITLKMPTTEEIKAINAER